MATYTVVTAALVVRSLFVFFDPPAEPPVEATAVAQIMQWNAASHNPLGLQPGDTLMRTDPDADVSEYRCNYPGIGYLYVQAVNCFMPPKPYPSWTADTHGIWQPPVPKPNDGKDYTWNESTQAWVMNQSVKRKVH